MGEPESERGRGRRVLRTSEWARRACENGSLPRSDRQATVSSGLGQILVKVRQRKGPGIKMSGARGAFDYCDMEK